MRQRPEVVNDRQEVGNGSSQMRELMHRLNTEGRGAYMNKGMAGTVQGSNMNGRNNCQKAIAMLSDPILAFPGAPVYRVVAKKEMPITTQSHDVPVESNTSIERLQTLPLHCSGEFRTTVTAPAINPASSFNTNAPHLSSQIP